MNISREVITDLLPVYFSGEASADTRVLVEDYFRDDPDFERVARSAATPLEALKAAAKPGLLASVARVRKRVGGIAQEAAEHAEALKSNSDISYVGAAWGLSEEAEREKRDLESVKCALRLRRWYFGFALFFTLAPLAFAFTNGHISWLMVRDAPWDAAFYWSLAGLYWLFYLARMSRRTVSLVAAIFFTLAPLSFALHLVFPGAPALKSNMGEVGVIWLAAAVAWVEYFRRRR